MSMAIVKKLKLGMNLRPPQEISLTKFDNLVRPVDLADTSQETVKILLEGGRLRFPDEYARLTFALATGIGKTRLMGAIMAYLYLTGKSRNFVLVAPSSTIYRKLKRESIPSDAKYYFGGIAGFPLPHVYHAENAETCNFDQPSIIAGPRVFILTPSQIRPRSGSEAERRLRRPGDYGDSFVAQLAAIPDLVVCLDEGHRYGGDSWAQAVADLKPKLVIEMTATPSQPDTVLHEYGLREALIEGKYIKNIVCFAEQRPQIMDNDWEWDKYTLQQSMQHHLVKVSALHAYHANHPDTNKVKPVTLIACRDVDHARLVETWLGSDECMAGHFRGKILRVDNTQPQEEIKKLLEIENPADPTEMVVNVGMLREGWDVNNVYVIVPLRAMLGETLAIQTIGRGVRLPFGSRVGDEDLDDLGVFAFGRETVQEVIEAATRAGVTVRRQPREGDGYSVIEQVVTPTGSTAIPLPDVVMRVVQTPSLQGFTVARHVATDVAEEPTVKRVQLGTGDVLDVDALPSDIQNVPRRFGVLLVRHFAELGGAEDVAEATRIFREYFAESGCTDNESVARVAMKWGAAIFQDVAAQVDAFLQGMETRYENNGAKEGVFRFSPITYSIPAVNGVVDKDAADPQLHRKKFLVAGWTKSIYPAVKFDTAQEFLAMKILDGCPGVTWARNPSGQFTINTIAGQHSPDFVVLKDDKVRLIEIKDSEELSNPTSTASLKGKASTEWCRQANAASSKNWSYSAVPHDLVERCATLDDLVRNRYVFS